MQNQSVEHVKNRIGESMINVFGRKKPVLPESHYKDKIKIPKKTFGKYVNNVQQPRIDELVRISEWLNVNAKDLF